MSEVWDRDSEHCIILNDQVFSKCAKLSENLIFPTPWYAHVSARNKE